MIRKISQSGLKHIKQFEGLRMNAYLDIDGLWNIGYGSIYMGEKLRVKEGDRLKSRKQADVILQYNVDFCAALVQQIAPVIPLTQNMFDALVSYAHSKGPYRFIQSGVCRMLEGYRATHNLQEYRSLIVKELSADHECRGTAGSRTRHQVVTRRIREKQIFLM